MIFLEFFNDVNDFLQIRDFFILSSIELQNVGEVDIGVSLSDSEVDLKEIVHLLMQPMMILLVIKPILQYS